MDEIKDLTISLSPLERVVMAQVVPATLSLEELKIYTKTKKLFEFDAEEIEKYSIKIKNGIINDLNYDECKKGTYMKVSIPLESVIFIGDCITTLDKAKMIPTMYADEFIRLSDQIGKYLNSVQGDVDKLEEDGAEEEEEPKKEK